MITSSGVPTIAWLREGEVVLTLKAVEELVEETPTNEPPA